MGAAFTLNAASRQAPRRRRLAYLPYAVAVALIVAVALTAALTVHRRQVAPGPGATGRPALAVLPFEDRSADPAAKWLSTGIASMLVTSLAQTPGLDVIGTERLEASFRELGRASSDRSARVEAARHAGAGAVLFGTLFKVGADIRVDVQVQDVATGRLVFARSEDGRDLFSLVDAVAGQVRAALDVANRPGGRPLRDVTTTSLEAYALYAKAQDARHNNRWNDARTLFEEALRADPAFTLARAQLVTMLDRLGETAAAMTERRVVAGQLERLPERERLLAEAVEEYDTDPAQAVVLLEQLLARYPDDEEAYDAIVHAYTHARDPAYWQKTLALMQRWARAIPGPGSGHFHNHYGYAYVEHGLFTEAEREFRAYIRVSPDEANAYDSLAELFLMTGRPAMAIEGYDQALRLNPLFGWSRFGRAYALAELGRYDDAFAGLMKLQDLGPRAAVPAAVIEMLEALLSSRVGRYPDATNHLNAARRVARALGDTGAQADADLFEAMLAVERGQNARAVDFADRVARGPTAEATDIMRVRRLALAHLIAGIAETRSGRIDSARTRQAAQRTLDVSGDPIQRSWQNALTGEIALAAGRLDDAEHAFRSAEYQIASSFAIYPATVALANNLPFRDGLARTALARGDQSRALDVYRRLNQPDAASTWNSVFDPRYAQAAAQLALRTHEKKSAAVMTRLQP
jgi:tetratricopeptide (TPR) repeat protein